MEVRSYLEIGHSRPGMPGARGSQVKTFRRPNSEPSPLRASPAPSVTGSTMRCGGADERYIIIVLPWIVSRGMASPRLSDQRTPPFRSHTTPTDSVYLLGAGEPPDMHRM
jgi:hypothetical protein